MRILKALLALALLPVVFVFALIFATIELIGDIIRKAYEATE